MNIDRKAILVVRRSPAAKFDSAQIAEDTGIDQDLIQMANAVENKAVAAVVDAVLAGDVDLTDASRIAKMPQDVQLGALSDLLAGKSRPESKPT